MAGITLGILEAATTILDGGSVRIYGVCPTWKRPRVTRFVLEAAKRVRGMDRIYAVCSPPDNPAAGVDGIVRVHAPNDNLGLKWQAGIDVALEDGADYILIFGSDDWLHPSAIDRLMEIEGESVAAEWWGCYGVKDGEFYQHRYLNRDDGAMVRLYRADFIREKLGGKLYTAKAPFEAMDNFAAKRIEANGGRVMTVPGPPVNIAVRSGEGEQIYPGSYWHGASWIESRRAGPMMKWASLFLDDIKRRGLC